MIWLAFRATPGLEFRVADDLGKLADTVMVPASSVTIRRRSKGEPRKITRPIAPGYVFAAWKGGFQALEDCWHPMRLIRGLHGVLRFGDRLALLSPLDVAALRAMAVAEAEATIAPSRSKGDRVRIKRGHYAAIRGIVERLERGNVVAIVDMFGKRHRVTVPEADVETDAEAA